MKLAAALWPFGPVVSPLASVFATVLAAARPNPARHHEHSAPASSARARAASGKLVAFVDPEEYTRVVDQFYRPLYIFALSLARNEPDAWDLTHDTFMKWVQNQHRIRDRDRTKTWLFTTLYRRFLDQARHRRRHDVFEGEHPAPVENPDSTPAPGIPDARAIDREHVLRCLQGLPENYRAPLTLFYLEDCSYKEIARILDIRIGTVMSRLARAKAMLAERIERTDASPPLRHET